VIDFQPVVDDVLSKVHFSTNYPDPSKNDTTQVQQVIAEWDLPVEKEKDDESVSKK
jgi:hypothetical protein